MIIGIHDLCFSYGNKQVLRNLTVDLPNPVTVLEGASGSGKTTLLKLVAGLLKPDSGEITGVPERVAMMFQEDRLLPWFNGRRNVEAVLKEPGDVSRYLDLVELGRESEDYPRNLSGGQQRRVALARALAFEGEALLLDEPMKGLDEALVTRIIPRVKALGIPIFVTSHSHFETELWGGTTIKLSTIEE